MSVCVEVARGRPHTCARLRRRDSHGWQESAQAVAVHDRERGDVVMPDGIVRRAVLVEITEDHADWICGNGQRERRCESAGSVSVERP